MRFPVIGLSSFIAGLVAVHFVVLNALPGYIMDKARSRLLGAGLPVHTWQMSPRVSPQTQTIVRPAPDLAYAICLIDLSGGPVTLKVPTWPEYGSLSLFDAHTDNVYAGSLDARLPDAPGALTIIVATADQPVEAADGVTVVRVKKPEALALIRRLAPSQDLYDAAAALVPISTCGPA
ncbi:MAG: DUF1254 domain-containing protein [Hyphomonas sp.]|uniref:DUF1254 domain-containing protein n=1 Tax=Hyphomonas sp. TaxID=87 RepID=UPI0018162DE6|nr:DUF1254 domain-containing protein [Hyphomonas sp.]MBA3068218.1 DUF1254 domain-containing protein [Hyphomonas sp.]MBU4060916.1 DUF1254 domain-containing protein [Alphaproteobacteria bacterium]MBU4164900.1 DUF1254 domain-containing protein [Alphaproteobacteria bacterium]MBU4569334.1 DUF1254 domain-containing protein [Alphaproteobacteria bacterium]